MDHNEELNPFLASQRSEEGGSAIQLTPFPTIRQAMALHKAKSEEEEKKNKKRSCLFSPCFLFLLVVVGAAVLVEKTIGMDKFNAVIGQTFTNSALGPYIANGVGFGETITFSLYREGYEPLSYFPSTDTTNTLSYKFLSDFAGIIEPSTVTYLRITESPDGETTELPSYYTYSICPMASSLLQKMSMTVQCYTGDFLSIHPLSITYH